MRRRLNASRCLTLGLTAALAAGYLGGARAGDTPPPAVTRLELARPELVAGAEQRQWLSYLAGCALPDDVEIVADVQGETHAFVGGLGLAPGWLERGLNPVEQRWVSACILARINHFENLLTLFSVK